MRPAPARRAAVMPTRASSNTRHSAEGRCSPSAASRYISGSGAADDAGEVVGDTAVAEDEIDVFAAARRTDGAGDASATQLFEQVHKPPYGADFRSIDFAVDGLFLLAERFQALFAYDFFGQDLAHDIVVAHAEGGLKLPLPLFDAVTLAEYFECPDMRPGVVHQYAVHIE